MLIGQNDWSVFLLASEILMNAGRVHTVQLTFLLVKMIGLYSSWLAKVLQIWAQCPAHVLIGLKYQAVFLLASESLMNAGRVHTVAHVLIGQKDWSVFRLASEIGKNAQWTAHILLGKKENINTGTNVKSPPVLTK